MFLYHYRENFGDILPPYIISKISPNEFLYWRKPLSYRRLLFDVLRFARNFTFWKDNSGDLLSYEFKSKVLISVGSIIEEANKNTVVWGAGISNKNTIIKRGIDIRAVRGPCTIKRMKELGIPTKNIPIGDPAILLPKFYTPKSQKEYKFGIICHNHDFHDMFNIAKELKLGKDILLISLRNPNIEKTIDEISKCECTLSTSLHGIIVSHSYGIPCMRIEHGKLLGDSVKFEDYYTSVELDNPIPKRFKDIVISLASNKNPFAYSDMIVPKQEVLDGLSDNLLRCFPYDLLQHNNI